MNIVILILTGYFLGSIPFAYLISRIKGVNILQEGTGIPGAANVYRLVGPKYGAMVLLVDILKATSPILIAKWQGVSEWEALMVGLAALIGHWFPILLRFKGGAGIASGLGIAIGMMPIEGLIALLVGVGPGLRIFRSSGHATALGVIAFIICCIAFDKSPELTFAVGSVILLVAIRRYSQVLYSKLKNK